MTLPPASTRCDGMTTTRLTLARPRRAVHRGRHHAAAAERLPRPVRAAALRRRPARPDRGGPPRDRRRGDHRDPPGRRLGRPRARPVPPDRHRRRRRPPLARLLADPRPPRRRPDLGHGQGGPRRQGQQPPGPPPARPGTLVHLEQAAGEFVLPARRRQAAVRDRRLRDHAGDRHAAQPVPGHRRGRRTSAPQRRLRHHRRPRRAQRAGLDLPGQPPRARRGRPDHPRRAVRRPARRAGRRGPRAAGARPRTPASRSPADRAACSTPSLRTTSCAPWSSSPSSSGPATASSATAAPSPTTAPAPPSRPTARRRCSTSARRQAC